MFIIKALWFNQNWFGRIQTIVIGLLIGFALYFRTLYGIYKHKEVQRLKDERTTLTEKVTELSKKRVSNNNRTKNITQHYKVKAQNIEQKRQNDETHINNNTVTDDELAEFIAGYEARVQKGQ